MGFLNPDFLFNPFDDGLVPRHSEARSASVSHQGKKAGKLKATGGRGREYFVSLSAYVVGHRPIRRIAVIFKLLLLLRLSKTRYWRPQGFHSHFVVLLQTPPIPNDHERP